MVVVSNGFNRFHMVTGAAQLADAGRLTMFLTGAYPTPRVKGLIECIGPARDVRLSRLLGREENVPADKIEALWLSEAICSTRLMGGGLAPYLCVAGFRAYALKAGRLLRRAAREGARIYHYRAGFGGSSVRVARQLGMIALCDHSIVHPRFVTSLPESRGRLDQARRDMPLDPFERYILADIDQADHLLVNSDFVKETFLQLGYLEARLSVIYQGVDDGFLRTIKPRKPRKPGPLRLLAPAFNMRKGAPTLVGALAALSDVDWKISITRVDPEPRAIFADFLADPRVQILHAERSELASLMADHDVVILPSYAEGSARVIFEALAAGLYVITTPNSGSVVQDGVHGRVVPAGDEEAIRGAVREAVGMIDRLAEIGEASAAFVRTHHSQSGYGDALIDLYDWLLEAQGESGRSRS